MDSEVLRGEQHITVGSDLYLPRAGAYGTSRFLAAVAGLSSTYRSPLAYATRFDGTRRDGIGAARKMALDDGCGCFRYTTSPYPLG